MTIIKICDRCSEDVIFKQAVNLSTLTLGELRNKIAMHNHYDPGTAAAFVLQQDEACFYDPALDKYFLKDLLKQTSHIQLDIIINPPIHQNSLKAIKDVNNTQWPCCILKEFFYNQTDTTNIRWVLKAVQRNGRSLRFASKALQANKEIVLNAVQQDGLAIQYASEHLKADKDIAWAALNQDHAAIEYIPQSLLTDKAFQKYLTILNMSPVPLDKTHTSWSPMFNALSALSRFCHPQPKSKTRLTP